MNLREYLRQKADEEYQLQRQEKEAIIRKNRVRIGHHGHRVFIRPRTRWFGDIETVHAWCENRHGPLDGNWMVYYGWSDNTAGFIFVDADAAFEFKMIFG